MKTSLLRRIALSAVIAGWLAVSACQHQSNPPRDDALQTAGLARERIAGVPGGSLTYRVISPPRTFNYLMASDDASLLVSFFLIGGRLIEFDHDDQRYVPGLAETWKLMNDERTVELTLRDNARFSDGRELTADDVRFTFDAIYDKRTASPVFRDALTIDNRQIEVAVVDARRVRLVFPTSVAAPESYLSNVAVLPRHVLSEDFARGTLRERYSLTDDPQRIVTAGAFMVQASVPSERVTLTRNPHYWKRDQANTPLPYLERLDVEVVSDPNTTLVRLNRNTLDIADRIRPTDYAALRSPHGSVRAFDLGPGLATDHMWFNLNAGRGNGEPVVDPIKHRWFSDVRFRRAVAQAIDRRSIASSTLQGLATPLSGFVSPGNRAWIATDLPPITYDWEQARLLLSEAGFTVRGSPDAPELYDVEGHRVAFTLIVPAESQLRVAMATIIQEDLAKLGIKMQVAPLEFGELTRRSTQSYDYDAVLLGANVSEPDPSSYTNLLHSRSPAHSWHPKQAQPATEWEARLDELLAAQAREPKRELRRTIFRDIQLLLAEQLPVIPLVARHVICAANTRIGNYRPSPLLPYSLWNAEELFISKYSEVTGDK